MKKTVLILYAVYLFLFTIFSYAFVDANIPYLRNLYSGFAFSSRFLSVLIYIFFVLFSIIFYFIFLWFGIKKKINLKEVLILVCLTVAILFLSYPAMLSFDIFNYIATSKVLFFYHENPYVVMPIEFKGDTLLAFTHAANKIALYGPIWIIMTGIPYLFGFGNFIITLFSFKLFISIFYLGAVFTLWKISRNIISLILFAFNPLVIIETLISGHNDIVMILFILFSFFLLIKKKIFTAGLFFVLSILIKYVTILLIPIFIYIIWKIIRKEEINWKKVYYLTFLLMLIGFLLSPIREEIYPWYALWFIPFSFLIPNRKLLLSISIALSFGLLFRYVPFILFGTHAGLTPIVKSGVTFIPISLVLIYFVVKKLWVKISYR